MHNKIIQFLAAILFCLLAGAVVSSCAKSDASGEKTDALAKETADVVRFRGNSGNSVYNGAFDPDALADGLQIVWQVRVNKGHSGVSIRGDRLYTVGNDNKNDIVFCLDAANGKTVWTHQYPCKNNEHPGPRATPTIDGTSVYTLSSQGDLFALDAQTGSVLWSKNLVSDFNAVPPTWAFAGSVVVEGDLLLFNANTAGIALDKKTGATIWASAPGKGGYATPIVFALKGKKYAAFFSQKALIAVDPATGKPIWQTPWTTDFDVNAADPLFFENNVFITSGYMTGCALFRFDGTAITQVWRNSNMASHFPSPVLIDNVIYGMHANSGTNGAFVGLDPGTGTTIASLPMRFANFIVVNGFIVTLTETGEMSILERSQNALTVRSRAKLKPNTYWTTLVYHEGMIFARNGDGDLFCLDVR